MSLHLRRRSSWDERLYQTVVTHEVGPQVPDGLSRQWLISDRARPFFNVNPDASHRIHSQRDHYAEKGEGRGTRNLAPPLTSRTPAISTSLCKSRSSIFVPGGKTPLNSE